MEGVVWMKCRLGFKIVRDERRCGNARVLRKLKRRNCQVAGFRKDQIKWLQMAVKLARMSAKCGSLRDTTYCEQFFF